MVNYKDASEKYDRLIEEQHQKFPPLSLPPEYAELIEVNGIQLLVKLARYKFASKMIRKSDNVLEVGSGTGLGSIFLSQHAAHVTGLEIKKHDYDAAQEINRRSNVEFLFQDFFEFDHGNQYDAVASFDVIEHMPLEKGKLLVEKMSQHCKADGCTIVGTPSIYSYPYQSPYSQAAHVKCYDQQELTGLMDEYFGRTLTFSMNDEIVHTGHPKLAWYYFVIGLLPRDKVKL